MTELCSRPLFRTAAATLLMLLTLSVAFGHAGERGFIMLLPTREWTIVGVLIVVATFFLLIISPEKFVSKAASGSISVVSLRSSKPKVILSGLFLGIYLVLIAAGWLGSSDPLANPVGPVMWSWFWIGMVFLHLLLGDIWQWINPFTAADSLCDKVWPRSGGHMESLWPGWLEYWPATALLLLLTWFENVSLSPYDPDTLALAMSLYLVFTLVCMRLFGRDRWLQYGELFSVYFRMIGWLAPLRWQVVAEETKITLSWPYLNLLKVGALKNGNTVFVLVALACVTFDGASHTYWWLSIWHINPLEFGGRSTVYWQNTAGLFFACCLLILAYAAAVWLSGVGSTVTDPGFKSRFNVLAVSLVPIAFGYHFAHYLPAFTLESQFALRAVSDPFALGWDLFGTANRPVIASVRSSFGAITVIWYMQMAAIVISHVLSIVIAHQISVPDKQGVGHFRLRQMPYAALMIAYTSIGLWLLSTASL